MTNGHVVPEELDPVDAVVAFHGLDDDPGRRARFRVAHQWWYRPSAGAGSTPPSCELDGLPAGRHPDPARLGAARQAAASSAGVRHRPSAADSPNPSSPCRTTSCSTTTNASCTIDHPPSAGSSGSPVFDNEWRLIGLHHSGGARMPAAQQRRRHLRRQRGDHLRSHPRASGRATSRCEVTPAGRTPWDAPGWRQGSGHPPTGSSRRLPDRSARRRASAR